MTCKMYLMVVILFIVISVRYSYIVENCPSRCLCISRETATPALYCDGLGLRSVPPTVANDTENISLRLNRITNITEADFDGLSNVKKLNLEFNEIEYISDNAFKRLKHLKSLNLGHNRIKNLSPKLFRHLHFLEELYINDNFLQSLDGNTFHRLPNLRLLFLQSNQLVYSSSAFAHVPNLVFLNLAHNKLTSIAYGMFRNSKKLSILYLQDNKISRIDGNAFDTLEQLTELRLHKNGLMSFNKEVLKNKIKLSRLSLYENPLHCDCNLYWINDVIRAGWILFQHKERIRCRFPLNLDRRTITEVSMDKFKCYGVWGEWERWSVCNKPCGSGLRRRKRTCHTNARSDIAGSCRGNKDERETCNTFKCSLGKVTNWSQWGSCTSSCNQGIRKRIRSCVSRSAGRSHESPLCHENLVDNEICSDRICPIDGGWSEWGQWTECKQLRKHHNCGLGIKSRKRQCSNPVPKFGGALCDGRHEIVQKQLCINSVCPARTTWTAWSAWSTCSVSCGTGRVVRKRTCLNEYNKTIDIPDICPGNKMETRKCVKQSGLCNMIQGWSAWSAWSECDVTQCVHYRSRECNWGSCGGRGSRREENTCNVDICASMGEWQAWSACSHSCNTGLQTRRRHCRKEEVCGVAGTAQRKLCNTHRCVTSLATWSMWGEWSACSAKPYGKQVRRRQCNKRETKHCPGKDKEKRICNALKNGLVIKNYSCQRRGSIPNGYEIATANESGLIAEYRCKPFYKLKGPSRTSCREGVGWSSSLRPYCVPVCGKRRFHKIVSQWNKRARIFGGSVAKPNSWPWQVAIEVKSHEKGWTLRCGGSLVNDKWVVTAGHCLYDSSTRRLFEPYEVRVFLGVHDVTKREKDKRVEKFQAVYTKPHPEFDIQSLNNDIGLIELDRTAKLSARVCPVCLPSSKQKRLLKNGKVGTVVGWGTTPYRNASDTLRQLKLPVVSRKRCIDAYDNQYNVTASMFCAGKKREKNQDTCKGDSGGGFVIRDTRKQKWTLQGIVSWGDESCGRPGKYSVYTRVTNFSHWIRRIMRGRGDIGRGS